MGIKSELTGSHFSVDHFISITKCFVFSFLEHVGDSASFRYEEEKKYKGEDLETLTQAQHFKHMHKQPPNRKELPHTNRCTQPAHPREGLCVQGERPVYQMVLLLQHPQLRVKQ
jgi:hypothetical protein